MVDGFTPAEYIVIQKKAFIIKHSENIFVKKYKSVSLAVYRFFKYKSYTGYNRNEVTRRFAFCTLRFAFKISHNLVQSQK